MPEVPRKRNRLDLLLLMAGNAVAPLMLTWQQHQEGLTRRVVLISGLVSLVVCNAAFLVGIIRRNRRARKTTPLLIRFAAAPLAIISAGALVIATEWVERYDDPVRLVNSGTPLSDIHPEEKRLFVDFLRRRVRSSREYTDVAATAKPIEPALYSVASFADLKTIESTITSIRRGCDLDFSYASQQQKAFQEFHDRMLPVAPESGYLKGAEVQVEGERSLNALQREWLSSVETLYTFAANSISKMHVEKGKLVFSDETTRAGFLQKLNPSEDLYRTWQGKVRDAMERQRRSLAKTGLLRSPAAL